MRVIASAALAALLLSGPVRAQSTGYLLDTSGTYASAYSSVLSSSTAAAGSPVTLTLTPTGKPWGPNLLAIPSADQPGTWSPVSAAPTAGSSTPLAFTFTPTGAGSVSITSKVAPTGTSAALTVTAYVAPGPTLTMSSAAYGTGNAGQGLTGGSGTAQFTLPSNSDYTIEFWAKLSSAASGNLVSGPDNTSSGTSTALAAYGDGTVLPVLRGYNQGKSAVLSDGAFHHFALSVSQSASTYAFHADGVVVFSGNNGGASGSMPANPAIKVSVPSGVTVDQLRVSSTARYTGAFTPASVLSKDTATLGLYQFEGNGAAQ